MMDLSNLTQKTFDVSRGYTYNYFTSPAKDAKPTILLFHGWPDTARLWAGLINNYLLPNGYGVVAPDMLGFGETSKPTDVEAYGLQYTSADIAEILDKEGLREVISMGHDWGSCMCQRFYNFFPSRVSALVMVNVAYIPPTGDFDLDTVNKATKEVFGYGIYEYWNFFAGDDGAQIMNQNVESMYSIEFAYPKTWLETFCTPNVMRQYLTECRILPTLPFATAEHKSNFMERYSRDGFESSLCWYKSFTTGLQNEADGLVKAKVVNVPIFYWGGDEDMVCRHELLQGNIDQGYLPKDKVTKVVRNGGHFALLEKPDEFGKDVLKWLQAL